MSRKLFDDDGNEVEVPTDEELKELNESSKKVAESNKLLEDLKKELELGEDENFLDKVKDIKGSMNPNWKVVRNKMSSLEKMVAEQGKALDVDGNIVDAPTGMSDDEIIKRSKESARQVLIENQIDLELSKFKKEQREVVKKYFDKLSNGEEMNIKKVQDTMIEAARLAVPANESNPLLGALNSRGYSNSQEPSKDNFANSQEGQEAGKKLFGNNFGKSAEERQKNNK